MLAYLAAAFFSVLGAFFRRFWGGWEDQPALHIPKIIAAFVIALGVGLFVFTNLWVAGAFASVITAAFLNPYHSKGQGMGVQVNAPAIVGPNLIQSVAWMSGSYGVYTALAAVLSCLVAHDWKWLVFAPVGLLASAGYLLSWYVVAKIKPLASDGSFVNKIWKTSTTAAGVPVYFIDGPTAIGELFLGVLLIGGLPIVNAFFP